MSQIWAVIGVMAALAAALIGAMFRATSLYGQKLLAEIGGLHRRIDDKFDGLCNEMVARFDHVHERFERLEARVEKVEGKVEVLDRRVETLGHEMHSLRAEVRGGEPATVA